MPVGDSIPKNAPGTGLFRFLVITVGLLLALVGYLWGKGQMPDLGPKPAPTITAPATSTPTPTPTDTVSTL